MRKDKLLEKILKGSKNIHFQELIELAKAFGFQFDHVRGSHHYYFNSNIKHQLNFQNVNGKAKPYQVKQLLKIIEKYNLKMEK